MACGRGRTAAGSIPQLAQPHHSAAAPKAQDDPPVANDTPREAMMVDADALADAQGGNLGGGSSFAYMEDNPPTGTTLFPAPFDDNHVSMPFGTPPPGVPDTDLVLPPHTSPHSLTVPGAGHASNPALMMSLSDSNALFLQQSSSAILGNFVPVPIGSAPEEALRALLDVQAILVQRLNQGHYFGPVTFIYKGGHKVDLLLDPLALSNNEALCAAHHRWSVEHATELQFLGLTPLFGARLLATVLQQLLSPCLFETVVARVPGDDSLLIQDGVLLWLLCWKVLFPTTAVFTKAFTAHCDKLTLDRFGNDFPAFVILFRRLINIAARHNLESSQSLLERFLHGCVACPRPIVQHHFRAIFILFVANPSSDQWDLSKLLDEAERLYSLAIAFNLPDHSFTPAASPGFSLAGIQSNDGVIAFFTEALKAAVASATTGTSTGKPSSHRAKFKTLKSRYANLPKPTWLTDAPINSTEVRTFNEKEWKWCPTCTRWTTCLQAHKNCSERLARKHKFKSSATASSGATAAMATTVPVSPASSPALAPVPKDNNPFGDLTATGHALAAHFATQLRLSREAAGSK